MRTSSNYKQASVLNLWLLALGVFVLCYYLIMHSSAHGGADAYWHYLMSAFAFEHPELFINHWAKPFFVLLSAPFAQLGFNGVVVYNLIAGLATAFITCRIGKSLGLQSTWFIILSTLFAPMYLHMMCSAMTEMTFALVLMGGVLLFSKKRFVLGALLFSALPFCRTEGLPLLLVVGTYLIYHKRYLPIVLLSTCMVIYGLIGQFWYYHDILWFFGQNPYSLFLQTSKPNDVIF